MKPKMPDTKRMLLTLAGCALFLLSSIVDGKRQEDDIREMIREEMKRAEEE